MLCLKSASKMCLRQSGYRNRGLREIFTECTRLRKERCLPNTLCRTVMSSALKKSSLSCLKSGNHTSCRCIMEQAAAIKSDRQPKSYFQQLMHSRKKQAQRSVLIEVPKKEDVPYAVALCESFGSIANAYSYDGESNNCFILLEFTDESIIQNLFLNCQCKNTSDAFPISSRVIRFEKKQQTNLPKVNIDILENNEEKSPVYNGNSISDLIEAMFATERLSEFSIRMRYFFCILIKDSLSGLFPYCDVLPFGSSVNGIGRQGCDLDVMLRLYPEEGHRDSELYFLNKTCIGDVKALQQKTISCIGDIMRTFFPGIANVQKILHARMPIIKLHHRLLKMHCDISINNVSAVLMSEIIHFCGEIDFRVRPLLHAVKIWAKESNVTYENPGTWITNFGLTTLVLYFLQNRPNPILPSFNDAVAIVGEDTSPGFRIQYLKSLDELKSCASVNEESLASLLKEFLIFLGTYSFKECIISLMSGKSVPRSVGSPIWVQYPFEEDLNVTKNVSDFEFYDMCEKASTAAQNLENSINQNMHFKDLGAALGIQLKRQDSSKSKKNSKRIDVSEFLNEPPKGARQKTVRHRVL